MKESVLDVLMYLFEHYFEDEVVLGPDQDSMKTELAHAGFRSRTIDKAFTWLEDLACQEDNPIALAMADAPSVRVYTAEEQGKLDIECRGFLLFLEQAGILDPAHRELVIDRVTALETEEIDLEQVKWVVQMVLFNRPDRDEDESWVEDLALDEAVGMLH